MHITPFRIDIAEEVLADLRQRLRQTRWPDQIEDSGWAYGTDGQYLRELVTYWIERFDWRAHEAALNAFPQFRADIDGFGVHFLHVRGRGASPFPLLITHGWPGSIVEFTEIIGPLTDPAAHGGDSADAFDLVMPSLPGYGFSDKPAAPGMDSDRVADLFAQLMPALGYQRWGAQGGDWGAAVTAALGRSYPDRVAGIHLNMVIAPRPDTVDVSQLSVAERAAVERFEHFQREESAYMQLHSTKPQTLGYALNDSPAGLAAWIVEKFRTWSDCGGTVERRFSKDRLLTNIMVYWVTQTINSSMRLYYETLNIGHRARRGARLTPLTKVNVPTGVAVFPGEIYCPPRSWAEAHYTITRWTQMAAGGHFAAMEEPQALATELREFFRTVR